VVAACCEMVERMCSFVRYGEEGEGGSMVIRAEGGKLWCASWERAAYWSRQSTFYGLIACRIVLRLRT
jgi:hypothetical protein